MAEFLSSVSIAKLASLNKPIFWTLHDMRPLTGGCHYPADCSRFREACGNCPQLREEPLNLTGKNVDAMSSAMTVVKPILVTPSQWMKERVRESKIGRECISYCIPYGIDNQLFQPLVKAQCRSKLGLDQDAWYILITAHDFFEIRKGILHAFVILEKLKRCPSIVDAVAMGKIRLVCCGRHTGYFQIPGWQIDRFEYVSPTEMPLFYNSANVVLCTSLEESFGNILPEAMACGIPVLSHPVGAAKEILNSYPLSDCLLTIGDTFGAVAQIVRLFLNQHFYQQVSSQSIETIKVNYSIEKQALAYLQLYTDTLTQFRSQGTPLPMPYLEVPEGSLDALLSAIEKSETQLFILQTLSENLKKQLCVK